MVTVVCSSARSRLLDYGKTGYSRDWQQMNRRNSRDDASFSFFTVRFGVSGILDHMTATILDSYFRHTTSTFFSWWLKGRKQEAPTSCLNRMTWDYNWSDSQQAIKVAFDRKVRMANGLYSRTDTSARVIPTCPLSGRV